jgi:hypothetical protein
VIYGWAEGDGQITRSVKFILCALLMLKAEVGFSNEELRTLARRGPREILNALEQEAGSPVSALNRA